jgi:membrane-associated protease RseP (regulator of RpoE activity)
MSKRMSWGIGMAVTLALATAAPAVCSDDADRMRQIVSARLGAPVTDDFAGTFGIRGVVILDAPGGSVARRSGMKAGDLILYFDGRPVRHSADLAPQLALFDDGGRVRIEVYRRGRIQSLTLKLEPAREVRVIRDVDRQRIVIPHEEVKKVRRGGRVATDGSDPADLGDVLRDVGREIGRTIGRAIGRVDETPDSSSGVVEIDMRHGIPDLGWH